MISIDAKISKESPKIATQEFKHSPQWQFDSVDIKQMQLLAQLPPGHRICTMLEAQALARGLIMGRLSRLYPQATPQELGLKLLDEVSRDRHIPSFR